MSENQTDSKWQSKNFKPGLTDTKARTLNYHDSISQSMFRRTLFLADVPCKKVSPANKIGEGHTLDSPECKCIKGTLINPIVISSRFIPVFLKLFSLRTLFQVTSHRYHPMSQSECRDWHENDQTLGPLTCQC